MPLTIVGPPTQIGGGGGGGGGGGSVDSVTAGAGMTDSGTATDPVLNVIAGNASIVVSANSLVVGVLQSDAMHGNRGGGALHADVVTGGASGFMTGAQATKLAGIGTGAAVVSVGPGAGLINSGSSTAVVLDVVANADGSIVVNADDIQVGILASDAQHGARGGGTQHAAVVASGASGFMTGADKALLDGLVAGGGDITAVIAGAGLTGGATSGSATLDVVANADASIVVNANDIQVGVLASDAQHGVRGGGTQHANAVAAGAAGFMTGADKTKLDGVTAGAAVASVGSGAGMTNSGSASAPVLDVIAADASLIVAADSVRLGDTIPSARTFSGAISFTAAGTAVSVTNDVVVGGVVSNALGSGSLPSYAFTGDLNTGLFSPGMDRAAIASGGTQRFEVSTTAIISTLQVSNAAGSAAAPAYSFTGDLNTGSYSVGADDWGVSVGGTLRLDISTTAITSTLQFLGAAGSASAPNWSYSGDPNTGSYSVGADDWGVATGGTLRFDISTTAVVSTLQISVASGNAGAPGYSFTGDLDTGVFASAANTLNLVTGGTSRAQITNSQFSFSPGTAASGSTVPWLYTAPASTAQAASTEVIQFRINTGVTMQHSAGALTTQRAVVVEQPTYSFVSASTLTTAATFAIAGAPVAGAGATITTALALWVQAGATRLDGNVGFFGGTPVAQQTVGAVTNSVTSGGSDGTIADFAVTVGTNALGADPTDVAARLVSLRNNQYQLARSVAQLTVAVRNLSLGA